MDDRPGTPADWRLDIPSDRIDLYLELSARPRPLDAAEATMLVELVDAWRHLEHRKHIALGTTSGGGISTRTATAADAGEILTVQRAAFLVEGQRYREPYLLPLRESLEQVRASIMDPAGTVIVAELGGGDPDAGRIRVRAGRLVGSGRLVVDGETAHISRIAVAPDQQGSGVGSAVLRALHDAVPSGVRRIRLRTGAGSQSNLDWYGRAGYRQVASTQNELGVELAVMERPAGRDRA